MNRIAKATGAVLVLTALVVTPQVARGRSSTQSNSEHHRPVWEYQGELGLSGQQVKSMQALMIGLYRQAQDAQVKLAHIDGEYRQQEESGSIPLLRSLLQEAARIQVELKVGDLEASRGVNALMTSSQRERWHAIQRRIRGQ